MLQQMMMLMRIEMQLRQQAMLHFHQTQDGERAPGLDDALALNSQLSEISSVLATLTRLTFAGQRSGQRRPAHRNLPGAQRLRRAETSGFARSAALRRVSSSTPRPWRDVSDDSSVADDVDNDSQADDDDDYDDDEINTPPTNDIVDNFIWRQLTESPSDTVSVDSVTSSPDGVSAISPVSDMQSLASVQSAPSFPSLPSISPAASERSLSTAVSGVWYSPSLSSSGTSLEGRPGTPRYVVCVDNYGLGTASDGVSVQDSHDDDDDGRQQEMVAGCGHAGPGDGASQPPRQLDVSSPPSHGAEAPAGVLRAPERHVLPVSQASLPAMHQSFVSTSPLLLSSGQHRPPYLNYAARLRNRQASELTRLPSQLTIRPWPYPNPSHRLPSPAPSGVAARQVGPSGRGSVRPLLPAHQGSTSTTSTTARQNAAGSARGRATRSSRYNGDHHSRTAQP